MRKIYFLSVLILMFTAFGGEHGFAQTLSQSSLARYVAALPNPNVCVSTEKTQALLFVRNVGIYECVGNTYLRAAGGSGGATNLDGLSDVVAATPAVGQFLRFNGVSWVNTAINKTDVGLNNVDNTSDANKPVSTAQNAAISAKVGSVIAGTNVTLSRTGDAVTISSTGGGSNAPPTTASNVGGGTAVFKQKVGEDLQLRTLNAGTNVSITQNANDIVISAAGGGNGSASNGNESLRENETFAQAITRIGLMLKTTLELSSAIPLDSDIVVEDNIALKLNSQAYFTSSNSAKLKIKNGAGLQINPTQYVFRGNVDAQLVGSYPDAAYPEWTGAVGDDRGANGASFSDAPTDNCNAIKRALNLFRNDSNFPTFSRYAHGGLLKFTGNYYSSCSLPVAINATLEGQPGLEFAATRIRFAKNKTGLFLGLTDRTDFEQPQPYPRNGGNVQVRNLFLLGDYDFQPDITNATVSGLTVTNPSAATFSYRDGYAIAEPLEMDGMVWGIATNSGVAGSGDSITPTNTIVLRPFAFTAVKITTQFRDGNIVVNAATAANELITDRFAFPQTWVGATTEIEGRSYTITAIGPYYRSDGVTLDPVHCRLVLNAVLSTPEGNAFASDYGSYEGRIMALPSQTGKSIMLRRYAGIDLRSVATIENVAIRGFGGDGIYSGLSSPTTNSATEPNTSNTIIRNVKADFNRGSAFNVNYANGNVILVEKLNGNYNDLYGRNEDSQLGNVDISDHMSFNGQYNYVGGMAQTNGSMFFACYMEDGGVGINLQNSTMWQGGTPSKFRYYSRGIVTLPQLDRSLNVSGITYNSDKGSNSNLFSIERKLGNKDVPFVFDSWKVNNKEFHLRAVNFGSYSSPLFHLQLVGGSPQQGVATTNIPFDIPTSGNLENTFGLPNGAILTAPNGSQCRLTVSNSLALSCVAVTP